jgi:hypothetical protein
MNYMNYIAKVNVTGFFAGEREMQEEVDYAWFLGSNFFAKNNLITPFNRAIWKSIAGSYYQD